MSDFKKLIYKLKPSCVACNKEILEEDIRTNNFVYCYNKKHIFMCLKCWKGLFKNG